jgi:hypothetical protein
MTNFVPGAFVIVYTPVVAVLFTQTSPVTAAPTVVLLVVSFVTLPLRTSSATRVDDTVQAVPVLPVSVKLVVFVFAHFTVTDVAAAAVPLITPLPPVFPVQVFNTILLVLAGTFAVPAALLQVMPLGAAAAGPAARTVAPANGTRAAEPAITPTTIRFLSTFGLSLLTFVYAEERIRV